jgi:PAS domain S-box-containing protein
MSKIENSVLRQFIDVLPIGLYIVDDRRKIVVWNQVAQEISGYLAQEVIGRSCAEDILVHCSVNGSSLCNEEQCPVARTFKDGFPRNAQLFLKHKDGHRIRIMMHTVPVQDESRTVVAVGQLFQLDPSSAGLLWQPELSLNDKSEPHEPEFTERQLQLHWDQARSHLAVFLIDVEKLHELELNRGLAVVQTALHTIAKTVEQTLWTPHYLGPWTDHRFLLMITNCDQGCVEESSKELQSAISSCSVSWWGDRIALKVQIKAVLASRYENPEDLLSDLDPKWIKSH